jgi:hypothetical protein
MRVLGEDLVLFRDPLGRYGLLDRRCAHRGRYQYWSMVSIFIAGVMCLSEERRRFGSPSRKVWACIILIPAMTLAAVVVVHAICGDALSQLS